MKSRILITLFTIFLSQIGSAQNFNQPKLDSLFNTLEKNNKFMGSIAVAKSGEVIYSKSVGYADIDNKIKASIDSKYRIGSITKSFTAVLVFKAIEENKLKLDQKIHKWFPSIKHSKKITIQQLLSHRSGIHNFTNNENYLSWNTSPKTEIEMIKTIAKGGSDFKPNTKAQYSNSNYVLLSYILEKVYSKSYANIVDQLIVKPLDLKSTYVFNEIGSMTNECKSYQFIDSWELMPETHYSVPLGAGAITSTPIELVQFADALFSGNLISTESLNTMKTITGGYGSGLFPIPFYNNMGYGHTGGIDGFSSVYVHFTDGEISYALTSNGSNYDNNNISIAVLSAVFDKPFEIPTFTNYEVTTEDLDKYLGLYTSSQIALEISITKKDDSLIAQATGQPALPLEASEKDTFTFDQAGAKFKFNTKEKSLTLFQGGGEIVFMLEE